MELNPADLIFVRGSGLVNKSIEFITNSPFSHVAGVMRDKELIEAQGFRKTGYQSLDFYRGCGAVYRCEMLSERERTQIVAYAKKQVGTRYDYVLILWELLRYTVHKVFPYVEMHSYICSTLWTDAYRSVGIDLCPGKKYPSPADMVLSPLLEKIENI